MEGASETFVGYEYRTAARISECCFPSMLCKWTVTSLCMIAIWHGGKSIELKSDLSFSLFSHPVDTWFWRGHSTYLENFSHQWRVAQDITSNMYCSSVVWALFFTLLKKKKSSTVPRSVTLLLKRGALLNLWKKMHIYDNSEIMII